MKKFLAICLTLAMLLGCFTVVSFAAKKPAGPTTTVIPFDSCDQGPGRWNIANDAGLDATDKVEGEACITAKITGNVGTANFYFEFYAMKESPVDISEATHLVFELYVSDVAALKSCGQYDLELTSSGGCDVNEITWMGLTSADLEDGWNTVSVPMMSFKATNGTADLTKINYMRFFNQGALAAGDELLVKLDNVRFEDRGDVYSFYPSRTDGEYVFKEKAHDHPAFYFTDGNAHVDYRFEIPESMVPYVKQVTFSGKFSSNFRLDVSQDCRQFKTVVSAPGLAEGSYTYDLTPYLDFNQSNVIFVRIKNSGTGGNGGRIYYDTLAGLSVTYTDRMQRSEAEFYNFFVFKDTEEKYLYQNNAGVTGSGDGQARFCDQNRTVTYKFDLSNNTDIMAVYFKARVSGSNGLEVNVSVDGQSWKTAYTATGHHFINLDLTKFIDFKTLEETSTIYVQIADSTKEAGHGGQIIADFQTSLAVVHNPPPVEMAGAVNAMRRIFNNFELLKVCPFLSRFFSQQIELG